MRKKPNQHSGEIEVTAEERQEIYQRLLKRMKRNHIHHEIGRRPLDVPVLYERRVRELADRKYRKAIEPYLAVAYERYPGRPGLPSRLKQHDDVIGCAEELAGIPDGASATPCELHRLP